MTKLKWVAQCFGLLLLLTCVSCESVKEYQKGKINDSEMVLSNRKIQKLKIVFKPTAKVLRELMAEKPVVAAVVINFIS